MTTPNNVQNEINAVPWTNSRGLVTGATVSGLLTAIVALFALYGSLSGANTWTGSNNFTGTGDVSTLSSTATRGTTAVTNAVRADVHLSVEDFGAVGDCGTTDNTAAINNAVAALRAQTGYASRGELDFGVDKCYMAGSINMTALTNVTVDFHGSTVLTSANGNVSAIDAVQGNAVTIRNLYLTNFNSNVPYNAIQIGRMLNGYSGAGSITLDNVFVDGYFSQSALYDRAAEVSSFIGTSINNRYATGTPYSAIFDGEAAFQAYSNYASTYNPSNPSVQDALYGTSPGMSMNETVWLEGTISSYYGPAIWNGATRALDLIDTYTAAYSHSGTAGPCFIQNTIASYQTSELSIRSHCEGNISSMFQFTGAASQTILGLLYANHYDNLNANGTEFSLGSGVTSVTIRNINYKVYNTLNLGGVRI